MGHYGGDGMTAATMVYQFLQSSSMAVVFCVFLRPIGLPGMKREEEEMNVAYF